MPCYLDRGHETDRTIAEDVEEIDRQLRKL